MKTVYEKGGELDRLMAWFYERIQELREMLAGKINEFVQGIKKDKAYNELKQAFARIRAIFDGFETKEIKKQYKKNCRNEAVRLVNPQDSRRLAPHGVGLRMGGRRGTTRSRIIPNYSHLAGVHSGLMGLPVGWRNFLTSFVPLSWFDSREPQNPFLTSGLVGLLMASLATGEGRYSAGDTESETSYFRRQRKPPQRVAIGAVDCPGWV